VAGAPTGFHNANADAIGHSVERAERVHVSALPGIKPVNTRRGYSVGDRDHDLARSETTTNATRARSLTLMPAQHFPVAIFQSYFPQVEEAIWSEFSGPFYDMKACFRDGQQSEA